MTIHSKKTRLLDDIIANSSQKLHALDSNKINVILMKHQLRHAFLQP